MLFEKFLLKMDQYICFYLGLEREESWPKNVEIVQGQVFVTQTSSFKRHAMKTTWNDFNSSTKKDVSLANLENLGYAAGKVIAKHLVVSFKEPTIRIDSRA